jgi:hypothetical protein
MLAVLSLALALAAEEAPPAPRCAPFDLSLAGIGSLEEDLARTAGLAGSAPLWPGVLRRPSNARPLWLCDGGAPPREVMADPQPPAEVQWAIVPPTSFSKVHSGWADDRNDGALWAGKGLSTEVTTGVRGRWEWLTAQLAPLAAWQENRAFYAPRSTMPGYSPYANPFNSGQIDLPLRMGPSAFWTLDWGQSYVRADAWNLAVGFSTENLWWGPGIRNSLLMSNSAAGFPHAFIGTTRPHDIWIGWLEAELTWGQLRPSKWFDGRTGNRRLFESFTLSYEPSFARGLTLGFARVFLFPTAGVSVHHYFDPIWQPLFSVFLKRGLGGDTYSPDNQLLSLFFRWAFPVVQLEVYGEWGHDDHSFNLTDFLMEPGHSQAYLFGLQKLFPAGSRWVRLQAEMTHTLETLPANPTRIPVTFYLHGAETQGYTQGGQMLGAGLGPQGDTQFLAVDWYTGAGRFGAFVERIVRNDRYFYDSGISLRPGRRHDLEMTYGLRGSWAWREWDFAWELGGSHRYALDFGSPVTGFDGMLLLRWWPGRAEPPVLPERR